VAATLGAHTFDAGAADAVEMDWIAREPGVEIGVSVAAVLANGTSFIPQQKSGWGPSWKRRQHDEYGDPSDLTGNVLGSSWMLVAGYALEVEYYSRHGVADPAEAAGRTVLIDLQSLGFAVGIASLFKRLAGRCRPRAWSARGCDEHNSFPSGHTVMPSALAGSRLLLALRSTDAPERYAAFGITEAMSLTTAALRMLAGAHSWEDVLGGWLIGHATGSIVSLAHPTIAVPAESPAATNAALTAYPATPSAPLGFVWSGQF
jgi:hypothetical protein